MPCYCPQTAGKIRLTVYKKHQWEIKLLLCAKVNPSFDEDEDVSPMHVKGQRYNDQHKLCQRKMVDVQDSSAH